MKLMNLFVSKKNKEQHHEKESSCTATVTSGDCSESSSKKNKKTKRNGSKTKKASSIPREVQEHRTPSEMVVAGYVEALDRHASVEELLEFFASKDVKVKLEDGQSINALILAEEDQKLYKSFPNMKFGYQSIKEDRAGLVVVEELQVSGTYTGEPYGFDHFPPVSASNEHAINDPERMWFAVKDGKIQVMEIISLGDNTGPPGLYLQIGGKMDMQPPPAEAAEEDATVPKQTE
ncbi:expressed unknown protein [Seminavis robusta]|uniref:Uncharacterized protein n=1 Tax=Seminavis robusta TaxID=568900 RepID=A0A9N8D645_9STRA|nr:expressed unknown protein [Seminavis robusta]|eukprot:Sro10_g007900.1 n/a (234) ;mRNA; r:38070-38771